MNKEDINLVKFFIDIVITSIIEDRQDRNKFVEKVFKDVVKYIEECGKEDWYSEDIRIALARLILKKFEVE